MLIKLNSSKILFLFLAWSSYLAEAQIFQPDRFEMGLKSASHEIVSANEDGLFIMSSLFNQSDGGTSWEIMMVDTAFNAKWCRTYQVPQEQILTAKYYEDGKLYCLFTRNGLKNRDMELIVFDGQSGTAQSSIIKNFVPFSFFDFKVYNDIVVIAAYFNNEPLVIFYDLLEGIPHLLPGLFGDRKQLLQLIMNDDNTFDITLLGRDFNKMKTIYLNTYDLKGNLIKSLKINPAYKKDLLFGMSAKIDDGSRLVAGIYGRAFSDYSKGLFLARVNEVNKHKLTYYNYAELNNFFSYMKERREERVKERIDRKKIKGKEARFSYRLMVHDLIDNGEQFILLGEAFYPKYRMISGNYGGSGRVIGTFNNGFVNTNRIFEGYYYTHAVVIGFDKKGKLLWDNSFEINDVLSMDLKQFVQVSISESRIALLYIYNNSIRSKIIHEDEVVVDSEISPIKLKYETDSVSEGSTDLQGLEHWYGQVFYTYGVQSVKNQTEAGVDLNRDVFFINKVIYK